MNTKQKTQANRRSPCPISFSLDIFGDKWTLLVIRDLMFFGKRYYGELLASPEGVATNILAERLTRLEAAGIIDKTIDPEHRSRKIYTLTEKGMDLVPLVLEMVAWGAKYDSDTGAPQEIIRRMKTDRQGLINDIRLKHGVR
ncbi:MAG: helix-turn-helix transcriptional regulator [Gammaproteobacteria bacterium]|nr:helix-turn-helix transcriptional regulator [Gammaproteobacteria bacterium]